MTHVTINSKCDANLWCELNLIGVTEQQADILAGCREGLVDVSGDLLNLVFSHLN